MAMDKLTYGTTIVVGTGVLFDLWVSLWLVDRPDTKITRVITITIVCVLVLGLYIMFQGWLDQQNNSN
jgi:cytochrome bd-type quinol oxidase subunit 1